MNLVPCASPCIHQKDGYCQLNHPVPVTGSAVDGCCYFTPKKTDKLQDSLPNLDG
ncbi:MULTISPECIES: hydroxymyristoyl-ACP dehydratase [Clostridiaceae]|uniref:Hydroxymyristoyl-ACP dehydratase n=1 Tax=Clostridium facile TaxID=2763035 RepID=A0ABR7IS21_9CLOT|nr:MULTISPECIES: hydroxymyristoyl-ACP dehydratase [Clostridiaceae]MBC5787829.1 hydroxymyristoyl-ACP dehydratase [Clostridium facile]